MCWQLPRCPLLLAGAAVHALLPSCAGLGALLGCKMSQTITQNRFDVLIALNYEIGRRAERSRCRSTSLAPTCQLLLVPYSVVH
jgi:hypothetical protein